MARMGLSTASWQFSEEFRGGAIRLVLDEGKTVGAVSRNLDLTPSSRGASRARWSDSLCFG